jgi:hypothetical protein
MIRTFLAVAVCLVASSSAPRAALAQVRDSAHAIAILEDTTQSAVPSLFTDIQLSATQQDSVDAIRQRSRALFDRNNEARVTPEIKQANFLALRVQQRAKMRTMLTAEQRVIFDRNAAAMKAYDEALSRDVLARIRGDRE